MKKIILYFGNELIKEERLIFRIVKELEKQLPSFNFIHCTSPEEILWYKNPIILDIAKGIEDVKMISIDDLKSRKIFTLHDFDLNFFLKIGKKLGIKKIKIIAIPQRYKKSFVKKVKRFILSP